jgi:hypothetical protein
MHWVSVAQILKQSLVFFSCNILGQPNWDGLALLSPDPVWIGPVERFFLDSNKHFPDLFNLLLGLNSKQNIKYMRMFVYKFMSVLQPFI